MDTVAKTNQPAPKFSLRDLEGEAHQVEDYFGKVVILNFWSAECPWAKRADELIKPMLDEWGDDVVFLAIASNANEDGELLKKEAEKRGLPILLHDKDQVVARLYGAITTPHIFVIGKDGVLRYQGAFDDVKFRQPEPTLNYLSQAVNALLAGDMPDPAEISSYGCTVVYVNIV